MRRRLRTDYEWLWNYGIGGGQFAAGAECHRAGTPAPIHPKDEPFVILRGKVRLMTQNDGSIIEDVVLSQEAGIYGINIPKGVWHRVDGREGGRGL